MIDAVSAKRAEASRLFQVYAQLDFEPASANGVFIDTTDGRTILDLYGGHAVACLGYAHPRIVETIEKQARTLSFQTNAIALTIRARAAERLLAMGPDSLDRVFFANSGAEANENALRLALLTSGREHVVAIEHGFHGRTAAAGAVTWGAFEKWYGFPRTPFPVTFIPRDTVDGLEQAITRETAAVILEPIQGVAGAYDLNPELIHAIRARCTETGALLIFDEVQSGVGRTGRGFAAEIYGVEPDILTTAKSLGGGFPISALLAPEALASQLKVGALGTTFGGAPMACALAEAVLETIETENLMENVRTLSNQIRSTCCVGPVQSIQGAGFLLGLQCSRPASEVRDALLKQNILVGTSGDPNVIRLLPPYILESTHVSRLAEALSHISP